MRKGLALNEGRSVCTPVYGTYLYHLYVPVICNVMCVHTHIHVTRKPLYSESYLYINNTYSTPKKPSPDIFTTLVYVIS